VIRTFLILAVSALLLLSMGCELDGRERVVWITPAPVGEVEAQIMAFNELHPDVRVETLFMGVGEIATRIRAEATNPRTDVASDLPLSYVRQHPTLFRSYVSEHESAFGDEVKDTEEHRWYGHYGGPQVLLVNTRLMPDEQARPRAWRDLVDPQYRGEIILANPALSSSAFTQLFVIIHLGGWELVEEIMRNAVITPSSRLAWQGVADGEYAIGAATENVAIRLLDEGYPVEVIYPDDGTNDMMTGLAMVANSPNPEAAVLLFEFLNSRGAHQIAASAPNYRRSVRPDVELHPAMLPTEEISFVLGIEEMTQITPERHEEILERFDELMARM
jgi:iron(III) transport system substrate-binding protein